MKKYLLIVLTFIVGLFSYNNVLGQCQVTSLADDGGGGTLRSIIGSCPAGNTITFAAGINGGTIQLVEQAWDYSSLGIEKEVVIDGTGSNITIVGSTQSGNAPIGGPDNVFTLAGYNGAGDPSGTTIIGLNITGGKDGIHVGDNGTGTISDLTFSNNNIYGNVEKGMLIQDVTDITVTNNNVTNNEQNGIQLVNVDGGVMDNNTVEDNDWDGLNIGQGTDGVTISNSSFNTNGQNPGPNGEGRGGYIGISSNLTFTGNEFNSNAFNGISFSESTNGTFQNNTVDGNGTDGTTAAEYYHGISVSDMSTGNTFDGNTVTNNLRNGIEFNGESSNNDVTNNTFTGNGGALAPTPNLGGAGVAVQGESSQIDVIGNTITGSNVANSQGVLINTQDGDMSDITVEDNDVDGNFIGVQVLPGAEIQNLSITNNDVINSVQDGVLIESNLDGITFSTNNILNNGQFGVNISPTTSGTAASSIEDNLIDGNVNSGMVINNVNNLTLGGAGVENVVTNNGVSGITINNGDDVTVAENFIGTDATLTPGGNVMGLVINGTSNAVIDRTTVNANTDNGIYISGATNFEITNANIGSDVANGAYGIQIESSTGTINSNTVNQNTSGGVLIAGATSAVTVEQNTIGGVASPGNGITVNAGTNTINDNDITLHAANGIEIGGGTNTITTNIIDDNDGSGILVNNSAAGTVIGGTTGPEGNTITNSGVHGIQLTGSSTGTTVNSNTINTSTLNGISIDNSSSNIIGNISNGNTISNNDQHGINITGTSSDNQVDQNTITLNTGDGIHIENAGTGNLIGSTFANTIQNNVNGVYIEGTDDVTVENNEISDNGAIGVSMVSSNTSLINNNTIFSNTGDGINLNGSSTNTFTNNDVADNDGNGVFLTNSSTNTFESNNIGISKAGADMPNVGSGIHLESGTGNIIGSVANPNIIGGTTQDYGVYVEGGVSSGTEITGNIFGTEDPTSAGSDYSPAVNAINVTGNGADVSLISENVIRHDGKIAIQVDNNATVGSIDQNYFGVENDGQTIITNAAPTTAVNLEQGANNTTVENNIIPQTTGDAILVQGISTTTNAILNNKIGVFANETTAGPITGNGVLIQDAVNTTVENNVLGNATSDGVRVENVLTGTTTINNNLVGTNSTFQNIGNTAAGISIEASKGVNTTDNTVGFNATGISYTTISTGDITGNNVGTNTADNAFGNTGDGIYVESGNANTIVSSNIIGNNDNGLHLDGSSNMTVTGNLIGVASAGSTTDQGNTTGILADNGSNNNEFSGTNVIAFSANEGLVTDASTGNTVSQNSMYCNGSNNVVVAPGTNDLNSALGTGISHINGGNNENTTDVMSSSLSSFKPHIFENGGTYTVEVRNDSLNNYGITTNLDATYTVELFEVDLNCENCQGETYIDDMGFNPGLTGGGGFSYPVADANAKYVITITEGGTSNTSPFSACSKTAPCTAPDSLILTDLFSGDTDTAEICLDLTAPEFDLLADPYVGGAVDGDPDNNFNYAWYVGGADQNNGSRDSTVDYSTAPEIEYYKVRAYSISDNSAIPDKFKDVPGCYVEDSILVMVHELPEFTLTQDDEICLGESAPLTVTLTQGASPFEFEWQDDQTTGPTPIIDVMDDTTWSVTPSTAVDHVYTLASLTDSNGCMATAVELGAESATIEVNPLPSAIISNITDDDICYNTSTDLTIDFTGTAPFTLGYYATTSDTFTVSSPTNQLNPFNTGNLTQDTTYHLFYVQDDNNCIDTITTESQFVRVFPEVTATISGTNTICAGLTDSIVIAFTGTPPFDYTYSMSVPGDPVQQYNDTEASNTAIFFDTFPSEDVYTYELVSVEDQFDCPATTLDSSAVKTVNAVPTASITGEEDPCFNVNEQYSTNSVAGNSYQWDIYNDPATTTGSANFVNGVTTGQNIDLDFTSVGDFKLRVVEYVGAPSTTACQDTFELDITVIDTINFGFTLADVCNEIDDYQFDATNVTITPAASWNGAPYTSNDIKYFRNGTDVTASGIDPSSLTAETYDILSTQTLDAADGACVSRQGATLTINPRPTNLVINKTPSADPVCKTAGDVALTGSGTDVDATQDFFKGPGVSATTPYMFDPEATTVTDLPGTNEITYIATSINGCIDSVKSNIGVTPPLFPNFTAQQEDPVCEDQEQSFTSTKLDNNFGTNPIYEWRIGSPSNPVVEATTPNANLLVTPTDKVFLTIEHDPSVTSCLAVQDTVIELTPTTIKRPDITDVSVIPLTKTKYCIGSSIDLASNVIASTINDLATEYDWIRINQNTGDTTTIISGSTQTSITDQAGTEGTFVYTMYATNIKGTGSCSSSLASSSLQVVAPDVVAYAGNTQGQLVTENAYALQNEIIYLDASHPNQATNYGNYEWTLVSVENRIVNEFVDDQKSTTNIPQVMEEDKHVLYEVSTERTDVDPGCTATDTVSVRLRATCFVPNGFTPNGDGQNDTWNIACLNEGDYPNAIVKIFNRWGELIYKDERGYRVPWDGTRNGELVPIGTYYFAIDLNDGYEEIAGAVGIIR